jgi:hypothetical protein
LAFVLEGVWLWFFQRGWGLEAIFWRRVFLYLGEVGLDFLIGCGAFGFCVGCVHFLSKCLGLVMVILNFKTNKFNHWHQNTTGKS